MSLKRILAGILSASLVLTVALSGCNNGQSGSADPSSSTGEGSSAASAAESEDTGDKPEKLQAIVDNDTVGDVYKRQLLIYPGFLGVPRAFQPSGH